MIASQIVGICRGYAKSYVVDMAMVIQVIRGGGGGYNRVDISEVI